MGEGGGCLPRGGNGLNQMGEKKGKKEKKE